MGTPFTRTVCVSVVVSLAAVASADPLYKLISLGDVSGRAINNSGQIVGSHSTLDGERACVWQNGQVTDLGILNSGDTYSRAYDINSNGAIVGISGTQYGQRGFRTSAGGPMQELWAVQSEDTRYAVSGVNLIDDNGRMRATLDLYGDPKFLLYPGGSYDGKEVLGTLPDASDDPGIIDLGNNGHVVGAIRIAGTPRAYVSLNGQMTDIGLLPGYGDESWATAVNDAGQVVGFTQDSLAHGFLWDDGVMTDLGDLGGTYSQPKDINNLCQIVGGSNYPTGSGSGFLWENGVMYDLNDILDASGDGWTIDGAEAINDSGLILADAWYDPENDGSWTHYDVLLEPVPEPASLALLTVGGFALLRRRRTA